MKIVTTCHKAGFELYGHRWIDGIKNWPAGEFTMYTEGFDVGGVLTKRCEDLPRLQAFKAKHAKYIAPSWRYDIVKFAHKVFVAHDAFRDHDGIGVWLDADACTYSAIPDGFIESLLPEGAYFAHFKRTGHYTETGMWIVDCRHPQNQAFFDLWLELFESGDFTALAEWHDCTTLDATLKRFESRGLIKTHSLSGKYEKDMHPMAKVELAKYIDHCKGPRKASGISPENKFR